MLNYDSLQELVETALERNKNISDIVLSDQAIQLGKTTDELYDVMRINLNVMQEAIENGVNTSVKSSSGLSGGDAYKMRQALEQNNIFTGRVLAKALSNALAVSEVNACMGRIVAAPTAGSCGILPAVLVTLQQERNIPEEKVVMSLFTAAALGMIIAKKASISGAEGGCQAECGSASGMAAAAAVEILGGTPKMAEHACAMALKNILGLVCDPVAGLVEVPCIKRNASGAANALISAEMAIPADEVIEAMRQIGLNMPQSLKETAKGGLAATPTGQKIAQAEMIDN
jgi:L-serine dehydratase